MSAGRASQIKNPPWNGEEKRTSLVEFRLIFAEGGYTGVNPEQKSPQNELASERGLWSIVINITGKRHMYNTTHKTYYTWQYVPLVSWKYSLVSAGWEPYINTQDGTANKQNKIWTVTVRQCGTLRRVESQVTAQANGFNRSIICGVLFRITSPILFALCCI